MAKQDKPLGAQTPETPVTETVVKKEPRQEIELKHGQVVIADRDGNELLTTVDDWNSLYKDSGNFTLMQEKKSS